jgi:hypothetical protein
MKTAILKQNGKREYRKTGLYSLRRHLIDLGSRASTSASSVGVVLRRRRPTCAELSAARTRSRLSSTR